MIGYFHDRIFETNDKRIMNFSGFKRETSGRWSEHERIGLKPVVEFSGPGLDSVSFTVNLNASHGVKPREELDKWVSMVRDGVVSELVIGGKPLGVDKWAVVSVSQVWNIIFNKGEVYSASMDITLKEYIEND